MKVYERKAALRRKIAAAERQMPPEERAESDSCLAVQLLQLPDFQNAQTVMLFSPFGYEPDLKPVLDACKAAGKRLILPRMKDGHTLECREVLTDARMIPGAYGILEPGDDCRIVDRDEIDFVLVPAVCYDETGGRLGHGAGYYDRFLKGYAGHTAGLCRNVFLQKELPLEVHDIRIGTVVTEERIIFCNGHWNRQEKAGLRGREG